jgi:hypothetical protein
MKKALAWWWLLAWAASSHATPEISETRGWLHLDGYTHHFDAPGANDRLFGLGFTWYVRRFSIPIVAWEGDVFEDSACKPSGYFGQSWAFPSRLGNFGVTGALMYHRNFVSQTRWRVLPVALPFWETHGSRMKLRVYYIPPVRSRHDHQVSVQLLLPLSWNSTEAARR